MVDEIRSSGKCIVTVAAGFSLREKTMIARNVNQKILKNHSY
jgi:hypothetical protein